MVTIGSKNINPDDLIPGCTNFRYRDIWASNTAAKYKISNLPNEAQLEVLIKMFQETIQPLRTLLGVPITVNCALRTPKVNKLVGGSSLSDHQVLAPYTNCAIDIDDTASKLKGVDNVEIARKLIKSSIPFYKIIIELPSISNGKLVNAGWIHISYSKDPVKKNQRNIYYYMGKGYIPITNKNIKLLF